MFLVFNRSKINSYLISVGTVVILFVMAFILKDNNLQETSARVNEQTIKDNSIIGNSNANEMLINQINWINTF